MMRYTATVSWHDVPGSVFATWTYPDECLPRGRVRLNRDRERLHAKLEKITGKKIPVIWRLERVRRRSGHHAGEMMPHWHMILLGIGFFPYREFRVAWQEVIDYPHPVSIQFDPIVNGKAATCYIQKYVAKEAEHYSLDSGAHLPQEGRHYGYLRKGLIPREAVRWYGQLTEEQSYELLATVSEDCQWIEPDKLRGFTLFGGRAKAAERLIRSMGLDAVHSPC